MTRVHVPTHLNCWFCGKLASQAELTRDHLVPKSDPRTRDMGVENTGPACIECNRKKRGLTLEEYRAVVALQRGKLHTDTLRALVPFHGESHPLPIKHGRRVPRQVKEAKEKLRHPVEPWGGEREII